MKNILLSILCLGFLCPCFAQTGWQWGVGNISQDMTEAGIVTTDKFGNVFGSGIIEPGRYSTFGSFLLPGLSNIDQCFIAKSDSQGNYQWVVGAQTEMVISSMVADSLGNLYVIASYVGHSLVFGDYSLYQSLICGTYALIKLSPEGHVMWARNFARLTNPVVGVNVLPPGCPAAIGIDDAQDIYISGAFMADSTRIGDSVFYKSGTNIYADDIFMAKCDTGGNVKWVTRISAPEGIDLTAMAVSGNGSVTMMGDFFDTLTTKDLQLSAPPDSTAQFIIRFNSEGRALHSTQHNIQNSISFFYNAMAADDMRIYLLGTFLGDHEYGPASFIPIPRTINMFVACLDSDFSIEWAKPIYADTNTASQPYSISVDKCGNICVSGSFGGFNVIEPPLTTHFLLFDRTKLFVPDSAIDPVFIAVYDKNGNHMISTALTSGGDDFSASCVDNKGNLYMCGDYCYKSMLVGKDTLPSPDRLEYFYLAKFRYDISECAAELPPSSDTIIEVKPEVFVYPNPASNYCTIQITTKFGPHASAVLYDVIGQRIGEYSLSGSTVTVSTRDLASAMYFWRIQPDAGMKEVVKKMVKD